MEGDFPPGRLLTSVRRLKEVFDACDSDSVGFIRPEHFEQLGSQFGHADQVKKLSSCLDPDSHGRVNFKDFCRGVLTMKGYVGILQKKTGPRTTWITRGQLETDDRLKRPRGTGPLNAERQCSQLFVQYHEVLTSKHTSKTIKVSRLPHC
ncbi:Rab11 family-interacting protein 4A [Liparis tanakae]|uniref:Rab11 family-interacting protein 4A n=1 Tax=Liparis tanakae TaxID=230148 RepID=A0A4Z2HYQ1_9TELE|nr:Rab11 family-interacting protein 4A [Liparis tanakae]